MPAAHGPTTFAATGALEIEWLASPAAQAAGSTPACATSGVQVTVGSPVGALLGVATLSAPTASSTVLKDGTIDLRCTYSYSMSAPSSRPVYVFSAADGVANSASSTSTASVGVASLEALGAPGLYLLHAS